MNDQQRADLKQRILAEIVKLENYAASLEGKVNPVAPDVAIGRLSRLDTMLNQGINESALSQSRQRIGKLQRALARMQEDQDFGECMECGEPIPIPRLLALPETELCVECAE
ncbi:MAG: TraR/DksA family transcriptional regulator [Desulfovibrio sp.]|nr:MAG: TraR/DksA family transcriptional regulator [Desulfovibrio sp.]